MLVLTRKADETIVIGDIKFTIVQIGRGRVRIGIDCPKEKKILRGELSPHDPPEEETSSEGAR